MAKFSDRMGITTPPTELQVESMNDDLRNSLWNLLTQIFEMRWKKLLGLLLFHYYKCPIDKMPAYDNQCCEIIRDKFFKASWFEVYNLIEYIVRNIERLTGEDRFEGFLNGILERELSGYRVVRGEIVRITDKQEVESVREAASESSSGLDGVSKHINKALHLLGKKPEPDYENSIKESISAVEAICCLLTGEKAKGLSKALKKLSDNMHLHPSLKEGFLKLYGYTSDEDGIRHSILEEKDIGFAEAKYMLVTCSAFVNFVKDKARKEGML